LLIWRHRRIYWNESIEPTIYWKEVNIMLDKLFGAIGYLIGQMVGQYIQDKINQKLYGDYNNQLYNVDNNSQQSNTYDNYYYEKKEN